MPPQLGCGQSCRGCSDPEQEMRTRGLRVVSRALLGVCQIFADVELRERRQRKGWGDAAPMGKPGAAVTCKKTPWMAAEPWCCGEDHPVLLLVSALAGGWSSSCCPPPRLPNPQQSSDFYIPDELRLQSSICGGGGSWDSGTAKTPGTGAAGSCFGCSANNRAEGGGLKSHL